MAANSRQLILSYSDKVSGQSELSLRPLYPLDRNRIFKARAQAQELENNAKFVF